MKILKKIWIFINFIGFYLYELSVASLRVAYDVITPTFHARPGIIKVDLLIKSEAEILALANLLSMTPGTLTVDLSDDRKYIFVHAMYIEDTGEFKARFRKLENKIHQLAV